MSGIDVAEQAWERNFVRSPGDDRGWVPDLDGVPVGFSRAGTAEAGAPVGELQSLYVAPSAWGSGAGFVLHDAAVSWLASSFATAELWVIEGNAKTRRFYLVEAVRREAACSFAGSDAGCARPLVVWAGGAPSGGYRGQAAGERRGGEA